MIKDDKGRYTNSKLWGDGWGWALYKSDAPDKQVAVSYKKDCQGCHVQPRKQIGSTHKTIQYSTLRNRDDLAYRETPMKKHLVILAAGVTVAANGHRRKSL
jgi:hypothetical protein